MLECLQPSGGRAAPENPTPSNLLVCTPKFYCLLRSVIKSEREHCVVGARQSRDGREVSPESLGSAAELALSATGDSSGMGHLPCSHLTG